MTKFNPTYAALITTVTERLKEIEPPQDWDEGTRYLAHQRGEKLPPKPQANPEISAEGRAILMVLAEVMDEMSPP